MSKALALSRLDSCCEITPQIFQQLYLRSTAKPRPQAAQSGCTPKGLARGAGAPMGKNGTHPLSRTLALPSALSIVGVWLQPI